MVDENAPMLWYDTPGHDWVEALPLGNGRLGAMVFGGAPNEHFQLNEATLWAGGPHDYDNPEALAALPEIRGLIFAEKFAEAAELANAKFMSRPLGQLPVLQTLGDLHRAPEGDAGEISAFRRELNLDTGVSTTTYTMSGVQYSREAFISYPDQVLVVRDHC